MPAVFIILVLVMVVLSIAFSFRRDDVVSKWAAEHHLKIISIERCLFLTGPFFFRTSKAQKVYRIVAMEPDGTQRKGYMRLGGMFLGMMSDEVAVKWDQTDYVEPSPQELRAFPVVMPDDNPPHDAPDA